MKKNNFIVIAIFVGMVGMLILISGLFDKKEIPRDDIQIAEETTTSDTTTTTTNTTTTTTKKVVKTTKKTTKKATPVKRVATGNKAEYLAYAKSYGNLNDTQLACLDYLWTRESNWNANDVNKSSGACGIPQAYPCSKIKQSEGSNDWKAQIRWGIKYINNRYKNPCQAWNHFKNKRWY